MPKLTTAALNFVSLILTALAFTPGALAWEWQQPSLNISNSFQFYQQPLVGYQWVQELLEAESEWSVSHEVWTLKATPWAWTRLPFAVGGAKAWARPAFELKEAWLEWSHPWVDVRVGQQQISWGSADQINPTDTWNPLDQYDLFASRKLGNLTARAILHPPGLERLQWEWLASPFFRPSALPVEWPTGGTLGFELSDSRMFLPLPTQVLVGSTPEPIRYVISAPTYPATFQWGSRLRFSGVAGFDGSISYLNIVETLPRIAYTSVRPPVVPTYTEVTLQPSFHRMQQFGLDGATGFAIAGEEFSLRFECALGLPDGSRVSTAPAATQADLTKDPYIHAVLGMDHTLKQHVFGTVLYFNVMGVVQQKLGTQEIAAGSLTLSGLPNLKPWDRNLIVYVEDRVGSKLKISNTVVWSLKNGDALIRPSVQYQWHEKLQTKLHADFFVGSLLGFYGQFYQDQRLGLDVQWFVL